MTTELKPLLTRYLEEKAALLVKEAKLLSDLARDIASVENQPLPTPETKSATTIIRPTGLLDTTAAAAYFSLSPKTLNKWRLTGEGPVFSKIGGAVRYSIDDLDEFVVAHRYPHTSAYSAK